MNLCNAGKSTAILGKPISILLPGKSDSVKLKSPNLRVKSFYKIDPR